MLYTLGDIKNDILVKLNHTTTMAFYTDAILGTWINEAQSWAAAYKKWPFTEGRVSTTFASLYTNEDGYLTGVYPEGYKADSIRRLTVGGKKVDKREFHSFADFFEVNTADTSRFYTNFGRLYYVNPHIDVSGTVTAWGQYIPADMDLSIPTSLTFFSGADDDGNEAISLEVQSYAKRREHKTQEAEFLHHEASAVLEKIWAMYQEEASEYETADNGGMWKRIDVLSGGPTENLFHRDRFF